MTNMKEKLFFRKLAVFLMLTLFLAAGTFMSTASVQAAAYVKQNETSVSITSKKTGWQKIGGDYYFYNSKGRLICGSFTNVSSVAQPHNAWRQAPKDQTKIAQR